jgi:hypothetical protein
MPGNKCGRLHTHTDVRDERQTARKEHLHAALLRAATAVHSCTA